MYESHSMRYLGYEIQFTLDLMRISVDIHRRIHENNNNNTYDQNY